MLFMLVCWTYVLLLSLFNFFFSCHRMSCGLQLHIWGAAVTRVRPSQSSMEREQTKTEEQQSPAVEMNDTDTIL